MSELINNREQRAQKGYAQPLVDHSIDKYRQQELKAIIHELHQGKHADEVRERFRQAVGQVSVMEISRLEKALMEEDGIPVSEVQRLCSMHADLFRGSIEEIHTGEPNSPQQQPGHPVHTFYLENRAIERLVNFTIALHMDRFRREDSDTHRFQLLEDMNLLYDVDKHYSRKENLLFPFLERYGIQGPTKVMWGVDDGIRIGVKEIKSRLSEHQGDAEDVLGLMERVLHEVTDMIFKEEQILLPMALNTLTEDEWLQIAQESDDIGYCLTAPEQQWKPARVPEPTGASIHRESEGEDRSTIASDRNASDRDGTNGVEQDDQGGTLEQAGDGLIRMNTGILSVHQLETLLNHLPVDLTFIDEHDVVRYFSHGKERIFARTRAVIGRTVQNCHPPQSVHVVNELLADFRAGRKDTEDFWIQIKEQFIYIRYFAVRNEAGEYMGTLEFTQNIKPIRELTGQKRILS